MTALDEIRALDPVRDHERIVHLSVCYDFPFDTPRALELALFRTFCSPSVSSLLDATGEFARRAQKRYDDTDIIVAEMILDGYSGERGGRALRRMNELHGRYRIANEDSLYVLSTFIYEPIRWNVRFGWRPLCGAELRAYFLFWREIGVRMGIRDLPEDSIAYEAFNREYEARHFRYAESNRRVGEATRELLVGWFPRPLAPLVRAAVHAMLEPPVREAFGFPRAPRALELAVHLALALRRRALALCPAPRVAGLLPEKRRRSYPAGHEIEGIGPDLLAGSPNLQRGPPATSPRAGA